MATYKVLQDIEAEDKLVGPLSLRQFIYAGVAAVALYICFLAYTRGVPFLLIFFLPVAMIGAFFGFPWKGEQPTEIWALARLRFMVKPRVRIWNQSGIKEQVTITAPRNVHVKPQARHLTQYEVQSRLKALADTIDSRGWATRNANYQYYANQHRQPQTDRLVNASDLRPGSIPMDAFLPSNDMMDDQNPIAQSFDALLNKSDQQKRQRVIQEMAQAQNPQAAPASIPAATPPPPAGLQFQEFQQPQQFQQPYAAAPQLPAPAMPRPMTPMTFNPAATSQAPQAQAAPNPYWFVAQPQQQPFPQSPVQPAQAQPPAFIPMPGILSNGLAPVPAAQPTADEQAMAQQLRENNRETMQINYSHMRVLQTPAGPNGPASYGNLPGNSGSGEPQAAAVDPNAPQLPPPVTRQPDPAILELANNDDLDVATLARQANRETKKSSDGVEIQLR